MINLSNAHSQRWQVPGLSGEVKLIRPEGLGVNRLMIFGEAGGTHEQNDLLPFRPYAQSGSVLERALRENGIEREHCLLTNTVWWQPWQNETPSFSARELCSPLNQELIEKYKPQCLLALGRTAFTELTGLDELEVLKNRGFIYRALPKYGNLPVVYTYHPSYLARGSGKSRDEEDEGAKTGAAQGGSMALFWVFKRDLRLAHSIARSGRVPEPAPVRSIYNPSPEEWDNYYKQALYNSDLLVSYDFENRYSLVLSGDEEEYDEVDYSELTQVQISIDRSSAMIADWGPQAEYFFKKFMELSNTKLDVNGRGFDRRYVRQMDCNPRGKWVDLQSLWHHFQPDLPRNLQFISSFFTPERGPWKHLMGQDMLTYGQEDSVRPIICYEELMKILQNFPKHPETQISLWDGYVNQVQTTEVSLDAFEARGVPIDREAQVEVGKELHGIAKEYNTEVQKHIPENLLPVNNKEGYKLGPPEFITGIRLNIKEVESNLKKARATLRAIRKSASSDIIAKISYDISNFETSLIELKKRKEEGPLGNRYSVEDKVYVKKSVMVFPKEGAPFKEDRWVLLTEFNPNSSQQMVNYINWKRYEETIPYWQKRNVQPIPFEHFEPLSYPAGIAKDILTWKVPIDRETRKATTGKLEIAKLYRKTKDPVLDLSLKIREVTKLAGTYVGLYNEETGELKKTSWTPGSDGLVHPFYHTNPATGQLGAKDPNCFSEDTEILTQRGWVLFPELRASDKCAQFDRNTQAITFELPTRIIAQDYEGPMLHISTQEQLDFCVTPNHDFWLQNRKLGSWAKHTAEDFPSDKKLPQAGFYSEGKISLSEAEIIFIAALQADGTLLTTANAVEFGLTKLRKQERLERVLKDLGFSYSTYPSKRYEGHKRYYIHSGQVPQWMRDWKFFDERLLDLDKQSFSQLAEEVWFWDGSASRRTQYSSSVKKNADWVQILTMLSGRRARLFKYEHPSLTCPNWQVLASNQSYSLTSNANTEKLTYKGKVYCVEMPLGTVVVRRGLFAGITGNSLNYPKHNKRYFKAIRRIVKPPFDQDRCVVEADYKAFHVLTTGFEAGCQTYMRLARLDMHSFFAATRLLRLYKPEELLKETDTNLSDLLKSLRKDPRLFNGKTFQQVRDKNAKPAILGYGFGMRGRTLYLNNEESFEDEHHANRVILELDEAFPIVAQWKKNVIQEADDKGYLLSRYGYIRWFNCVYSKRMAKPGEWIKPGVHYRNTKWGQILYEHGDDQEACVAFRPANNAFGMTREVYNRMQADGTADKWWSSIPLHDAIVAFPRWEARDECIQGLKAQMELPSPILNGLWCQAEFQVSKRQGSWADMEEIKV